MFVAYFPHLVAGPILRASRLLPQIIAPRTITPEQMRDGAWLIAWGFFQKIFVADNLAPLANAVFEPGAHPTGINVLLGVYAFAFQIYGDFAGYSNIARGMSKLMGIELIENFRFPYFVRTPQAFWRNWHISLSTWLRDYLYIPLGGNRGSGVADATQPADHDGARRAVARRRLDVRALGRLPGRAADCLSAGSNTRRSRSAGCSARRRPHASVGWLVMFHLTCLGWLIFRARSAEQLGHDAAQPRPRLRARAASTCTGC